jgi:hypothetical protein
MGQGTFNGKNGLLIAITLLVAIVVGLVLSQKPGEEPPQDKIVEESGFQEIVDGKHVATGLIADEGLNLVIAHCTGCHSAKLVTQNRFNKEGWTRVIRWMQETQNLWDLGESEEAIVEYLSKHYAPEFAGRRMPLTEMEWYELKEK